jgi:hypothetical protein
MEKMIAFFAAVPEGLLLHRSSNLYFVGPVCPTELSLSGVSYSLKHYCFRGEKSGHFGEKMVIWRISGHMEKTVPCWRGEMAWIPWYVVDIEEGVEVSGTLENVSV